MTDKKLTIIRGSGDWSALYVDGKLDRVGDHYWVDERAFDLAGVEEIQSDDFLQGGDSRDSTARTLEEMSLYGEARAGKLRTAEQLRLQAAELLKEAQELEQ